MFSTEFGWKSLIKLAEAMAEAKRTGMIVLKQEQAIKVLHVSMDLWLDNNKCVSCSFDQKAQYVGKLVETLKVLYSADEVVIHDTHNFNEDSEIRQFEKGLTGHEGYFNCGIYPVVKGTGMSWSFEPISTN